MAATITNAGEGTVRGSASVETTASINAAVGDWIVFVAAFSNDGTNGAASLTGGSMSPGGSATNRAIINYDPGTTGAGATLGFFTFEVTSTLTNAVAKASAFTATSEMALQVYKVAPGAGETISFIAADTTGSTGNATTHSAATVSVTNGDIIFGGAAIETDDAVTGDSDTTNGNWSSIITRLHDNGADASTMSSSSQYKTVTATGNQAWACTTVSARDSARTYIILRSASTGAELTLTKTLGTLTSSATATVDVSASLAKTLGTLTSAATATVDIDAALAKTLGTLTSSATAEVTTPGDCTLAKTLGALTSSATATVDVSATLAKTLGTLTSASAASVDIDATLAKTLGALAGSATATVDVDASLAKTLGALTSVATVEATAGASEFTLAQTLGALTSSAAASVDIDASLSKTLGALTSAATFEASTAGEFALTQTLGTLTGSAAATVDIDALVAQTLGALTSAATASLGEEVEEVSPPGMGPGWKLFGHERAAHPVSKRKKKVEDVEADLIRAYEDATGITAERERLEAIREIKRAAATALSVANKEQDESLREIAQQIIGLRKFELTLADYLARVGEILARIETVTREQEEDDLEALILMARLS